MDADARRRAEELVRNFIAKWHDTEFLIEGIVQAVAAARREERERICGLLERVEGGPSAKFIGQRLAAALRAGGPTEGKTEEGGG